MKIKRFMYVAECGSLQYMDSVSAEMVYRSISCYYMPSVRIIIIDTETHEASIFTRKLDRNGNLVCIIDELNGKEIY
jgi:hypothetical protein